MYGGFETTSTRLHAAHRREQRPAAGTPPGPQRAAPISPAFARATRSASARCIRRDYRSNRPSAASDSAIAPEPVPMSIAVPHVAAAELTLESLEYLARPGLSVSGRGMSTRSSTSRVEMAELTRVPTAYANGAPARELRAAARARPRQRRSRLARRFIDAATSRGTSSSAATMSVATRRGSAIPARRSARRRAPRRPRAIVPDQPCGSACARESALLTESVLDVRDPERFDRRARSRRRAPSSSSCIVKPMR